MLLCGFSELDITPPLGSSMPGYLTERKSTGIKDPLFARALVVDAGAGAVAFVVLDALAVLPAEVRLIREKVFQSTGIPPERVMVSATHTHTGPPIRPGLDGSRSEEYLLQMANRAADAVIIAYHNRKPARIGHGVGKETTVSFNRRYWMKDGSLRTNPGFSNPDVVRPAGPIDPDVSVLRIDDVNGNTMGVVTLFACHTDTTKGTEYSADYPAELHRTLKRVLGENVVSIFMLGACGDINHYDFMNPQPKNRNYPRHIGRVLAGEVLKVLARTETSGDIDIEVRQAYLPMDLRMATEQEISYAKQVMESGEEGAERFFADQILKVSELPGGTIETEIQAFRLGDFAVVGLPGEIFVELGLAIKKASPFSHTLINTLCNGSVYGYVCTEEAYRQGGYEPRLKVSNRITPGTGERFVEKAVSLLNDLR